MTRILYNPETDTLITWPRLDDSDVVGLQPPVVMLSIEQSEPPTGYDTTNYGLERTQNVDLDLMVLQRGWMLVPVVTTKVPRWLQFGQALAVDSAVNGLVAYAATNAPVLHLMLGVGLGQAAQGDPTTFLAAWANAVSVGMVPSELVSQMQTLATGFDLPAEFVAGLG